jgi:hypothetical protein
MQAAGQEEVVAAEDAAPREPAENRYSHDSADIELRNERYYSRSIADSTSMIE